MVKIFVGFFVLGLPVLMLFQNCGQTKSAKATDQASVVPGDEVAVTLDTEGSEEESEETEAPEPTGAVASLDFGYDSASEAYKYRLDLTDAKIYNAQEEEVKELSNSEFSLVVNVISGNRLLQGDTASDCEADEIGVPVYGRLNLSGGQDFVLNQARMSCGGVNFVDSSDADLGLAGILADFEAELEM